jgi:exonuclease SbcC
LRRTSVGVGIRNGRLERLLDPARLGSTEDETELIAADSGVNSAVEELLGLSFDHFCSCVVLPQGDFAGFLHAKPADRQKILTRLLGIDLYETIGQKANTEAAAARQRATVFEEQIDRLADITPEAEAQADQRVQQLIELEAEVAAVLPELSAATAAVDQAKQNATRIQDEQARLSELAAPPELAARTQQLAEAMTAANAAAQNLVVAEKADDVARRAFESAASTRVPLEKASRNHAEHTNLRQQLPDAEGRRAEAAAALAAVNTERESAMQELSTARAAAGAASSAAKAAKERVGTLQAEQAKLGKLSTPAGIAEIREQEDSSRAALAAASQRLDQAEEAEAEARRELESAPTVAVLQQAKQHHAELARLLAREPELTAQVDRMRKEVSAAKTALDQAHRVVDHARVARDEAVRVEAAAVLRPHLVAGEPCPVCEHPVEELPAPLEHETLSAANEVLETAEHHRDLATEQHTQALGREQRAANALETLVTSAAEVRQAFAGEWTDENALDAELSRLDALSKALRAAGTELRAARTQQEAAGKAVAALANKHAAGRTALNAARDPLVSLGAPAVDHLDLADGWNSLATWAHHEADACGKLLEQAEIEAGDAEAVSALASGSLARAQEEAERLDAARVLAARADQQTDMLLHQINDRLIELTRVLAAAPGSAEVAAQLARIDQLEADAKAAQDKLRQTRAARDWAAGRLDRLRVEEREAWNDLRAARDPLVSLGAPPIRDIDLQTAWTNLVDWADQEIRALEATSATAHAVLSAAESHRDGTELALSEALEHGGVAVQGDRLIAETASAAVAAELERARAHVQSIQAQLAQLTDLRTSKAQADDNYTVAHMLGGLLRSDGFPRWLVASALDVLIEDASASLAELSGGQFDLAHEDGEFVVIDHNNADLPRPVKTLSGGETFQASLALALALSAQITTLAAAGTARLDSIILDEGFGGLDETTLDTVASTLEELAGRGNRMVGVISHVKALAERVPVQFRVSRDQFGSTITRDNP